MKISIMDYLAEIMNIKRFQYSSRNVNYLYFAFCCIGAVYHSPKVHRFFKILYFWVSLTMVVSNYGLMATYIIFANPYDPNILAYAFLLIVTILYTSFVIPLLSYVHRDEINEIMDILDESVDLTFNREVREEKYGIQFALNVMLVQFVSAVSFLSYNILYLSVDYTPEKLRLIYSHFAVAYYENVDSFTYYCLMISLEIYSLQMIFFVGALLPIFTVLTASEFYNRFEFINIKMNEKWDDISKCIDTEYEKSQIYDLDESVWKVMQYYHERRTRLCRGVRNFRFFVEYTLSCILVIFFILQVHYISLFLSEEETALQKLKFAPVMVSTSIILFFNCWVGEVFREMWEMFNEAVYNSPWYHVDMKRKKEIYLFLLASQEKIDFSALGIYPLDMNMFQRMCNTVYSYANIRRTTF